MFNVSVFAPYHTTWFVCHNGLAGKDGHRELECQYNSLGVEEKKATLHRLPVIVLVRLYVLMGVVLWQG